MLLVIDLAEYILKYHLEEPLRRLRLNCNPINQLSRGQQIT